MALWGSRATQFTVPEDPNVKDRPTIVLFTGCLVKIFSGALFYSSAKFVKYICHFHISTIKLKFYKMLFVQNNSMLVATLHAIGI